jgi:hypothetical protein
VEEVDTSEAAVAATLAVAAADTSVVAAEAITEVEAITAVADTHIVAVARRSADGILVRVECRAVSMDTRRAAVA